MMNNVPVLEETFRGMTIKVWMTKPLSDRTDYYATVDGERVASGDTAEDAMVKAQETLV